MVIMDNHQAIHSYTCSPYLFAVVMYPVGSHRVIEVGSEDFKACKVGHPINSWSSGSDSVTLHKAGSWWFVCSLSDHCDHCRRGVTSPQQCLRPLISGAFSWLGYGGSLRVNSMASLKYSSNSPSTLIVNRG